MPSGLALLTALIPISPSPPVRFSTITLRSSSGPICCAISRQSASPPPPAAKGKTILVSGPDWANASPALADNTRLALPAMKLRRSTFLSPADDSSHYIRLAQGLEGCAAQRIDFRFSEIILDGRVETALLVQYPAPFRGALRNVTSAGRECGGRGWRS